MRVSRVMVVLVVLAAGGCAGGVGPATTAPTVRRHRQVGGDMGGQQPEPRQRRGRDDDQADRVAVLRQLARDGTATDPAAPLRGSCPATRFASFNPPA